jgi:hypothetical protein
LKYEVFLGHAPDYAIQERVNLELRREAGVEESARRGGPADIDSVRGRDVQVEIESRVPFEIDDCSRRRE